MSARTKTQGQGKYRNLCNVEKSDGKGTESVDILDLKVGNLLIKWMMQDIIGDLCRVRKALNCGNSRSEAQAFFCIKASQA